MRVNYKVASLALAGVGLLTTMARPAQAQVPFATFQQLVGGKPFFFNNATGTISLVNGAGQPVNSIATSFAYFVANGYGAALTPIGANMSLTAIRNGNVTGTNPGPYSQDFGSIEIKFTAINPGPGGLSNLLTITLGSTGFMDLNTQGSQTTSLQGTDNGIGATPSTQQVVGFSSDFLDFTSPTLTNKNFAINLGSAASAPVGGTPGITVNGNGTYDSFYASLGGGFGASEAPLVPTPAPPGVVSGLIGIAMGGAQFGMMRFRSRRRTKKAEVAEATEVAA